MRLAQYKLPVKTKFLTLEDQEVAPTAEAESNQAVMAATVES
jgi:hypothetical protein